MGKIMLVFCASIIFNCQFSVASCQEHSPTKAVCLSLLPGGGQVYNRQAWKVPIIYGAFAGTGYWIYLNYKEMKTLKDEYLYRVNNNDIPNNSDYSSYPTSNVYSLYNSANRDFQLSVIVAVGVYALNLVDAYVFGHLFDYQIDDDISMNVAPMVQATPLGWQPTLGVAIRF